MLEKKIKIKSKHGMHLRPAAKFVKEAKKFNSYINVIFKGTSVNAKSLYKLQTLGIVKNSEIVLTAEGQDEKSAIKKLEQLILELE
ncbi:Phosphocarrier protein HPr [Buchnera aphidicola (Tetraneura ulmi)]|uniref:HPr family phosphocarrier protein n=1 Tax=Buchnera aphidicola TaxID=9 RepID=UPI0034644C5C